MSKLTLTKKYGVYPNYKDSEIDWIGLTPTDWQALPLRAALVERKEKNRSLVSDNILSVMKDVGVIRYADKGDIGNKSSTRPENYKIVHPGDIVINSMNLVIGSVGQSREFGVTSSVYIIYAPRTEDINATYYSYIFRNRSFQKHMARFGKGIMELRESIKPIDLKNQILPIPPKDTQDKIVEFLDEKTATIDRIIEKKQRQIELLKEKRAAVINHTVTKGLDPKAKLVDSGVEWMGEIPSDWDKEKLKFVAPLRNTKANKEKVDLPYVGLEHIESATGRLLKSEEKAEPESVVNLFEKGDVLFSKLRPNLAKVLLPEFDGMSTGELLALTPNTTKIIPSYLFYKLISRDFINKVCDSVYGAKMPRANWNLIGSLYITYPSISEQKKIVDHINKKVEKIDAALELIQDSIKTLQEFKSSLISHAVTGKIKV